MYTILNPAPAPVSSEPEIRELLRAAKLITPNRVEALALAGMPDDSRADPDWRLCGIRLKERGGPSAVVVITLGSRGCLVIDDALWPIIAAPQVKAVDTVGAGDAFNGVLAAALAEGQPIRKAIAWANAAGALAVTRPGAQTSLPFREAIIERMSLKRRKDEG
jgi:ribokinase